MKFPDISPDFFVPQNISFLIENSPTQIVNAAIALARPAPAADEPLVAASMNAYGVVSSTIAVDAFLREDPYALNLLEAMSKAYGKILAIYPNHDNDLAYAIAAIATAALLLAYHAPAESFFTTRLLLDSALATL
jgi:hypothetical protein